MSRFADDADDSEPMPSRLIAETRSGYGDRGPLRVYGVGQIAAYLRELIETDPLVNDLWIAGEVTALSRSQAGHLYFSLTDDEGALRCVFFRRENLGVTVQQGDQVIVHGRASVYLERGDLQFYVDALQPEGVGLLHAEFQRLLARLEAEGLFEPSRKRSLPEYPRTVGVVTSPAGAVWHDIQTILARRWPPTALLLAPCRVQGEGAADTIVQAIESLNRMAAAEEIDVIIVARGGGAAEELAAFNTEAVARAIFASAVPIVSAVGHETDVTIADYVADMRAPTPSAAAELVAPDQEEERARLTALLVAIGRGLERSAERARGRVDSLVVRLQRQPPDLTSRRLHVDDLTRRAADTVAGVVSARRALFAGLHGRLATLDPTATLARGYTIVQDARGRPLGSSGAVRPGDHVQIRFRDGAAGADITDVRNLEGERPQ